MAESHGLYPLVHEYNLGYEYASGSGDGGVYQAYLYYYPTNANGARRYFYNYTTSQVITE